LGVIGWLVVLALIGFAVLVGFKLGPVYLEYYTVRSSIDSLGKEENLANKSPGQIWVLLNRRFDMNDVKSVDKEHVSILQRPDQTIVSVDYEVKRHLLGNVGILLSFSDKVEIGAH
jgi:hypothetical protein